MALGEIGLTGEILPVSKLSLRLKEAVKMNFTEFVLPARNQEEAENYFKDNSDFILENNGTKQELIDKAEGLFGYIRQVI